MAKFEVLFNEEEQIDVVTFNGKPIFEDYEIRIVKQNEEMAHLNYRYADECIVLSDGTVVENHIEFFDDPDIFFECEEETIEGVRELQNHYDELINKLYA